MDSQLHLHPSWSGILLSISRWILFNCGAEFFYKNIVIENWFWLEICRIIRNSVGSEDYYRQCSGNLWMKKRSYHQWFFEEVKGGRLDCLSLNFKHHCWVLDHFGEAIACILLFCYAETDSLQRSATLLNMNMAPARSSCLNSAMSRKLRSSKQCMEEEEYCVIL